ncbi:MAG TPA: peptidase M48, partial [Chitinophagales bacterium]|nr:peptidase M48 [Chitinophagales bacterium]
MIQPHLYLTRVKDHFKQQPATWQFFAQQNSSDTDWAGFKENLLKNAYRMSPDTEAGIYEQLEQVRQKLQISQTITLYQLEQEEQPNAFISFRDNEAHLVFCGPILKLLEPAELT